MEDTEILQKKVNHLFCEMDTYLREKKLYADFLIWTNERTHKNR